MAHPLEKEFGLTAEELLEAMSRRFRAKVTLEGVVAEVHLGKHIKSCVDKGLIARFEEHDLDSYPDYTIWIPGNPKRPYRIECKNVRDTHEAYREHGEIVGYKVETQKTRASKGDRSSRYYGISQFEILAVCLGKKTHDWRQFMFIRSRHLTRHSEYAGKLAVMHRVPLPSGGILPHWFNTLEAIVGELRHA